MVQFGFYTYLLRSTYIIHLQIILIIGIRYGVPRDRSLLLQPSSLNFSAIKVSFSWKESVNISQSFFFLKKLWIFMHLCYMPTNLPNYTWYGVYFKVLRHLHLSFFLVIYFFYKKKTKYTIYVLLVCCGWNFGFWLLLAGHPGTEFHVLLWLFCIN